MTHFCSLRGKVAIVTGGTAGIGKAIALRLASLGASTVICGRDSTRGEAVAAEIRRLGNGATFLPANVLEWDEMTAFVQQVLALEGKIDICVLSGGGSHYPAKDQRRKSLGYFQEIVPMEVGKVVLEAALSKITPARAVIGHMIERRSGSILFVTSEGGRTPTPTQTAVSFHAGGVMAMSRVIAKEMARFGIRVNTLAISLVKDTPSWTYAFEAGEDASIYEKLRSKAPFGLASPEDIASIAAFLVADESRFITGSVVSATGGITF